MVKIPEEKIIERWDNLPMTLREAMASDVNSDFVWKTSTEEFIPAEKIPLVATVVGSVLMGFIHPEDMAKELRDSLGVDLRIAAALTSAINQRVFTPLRGDIDKVYDPKLELIKPKVLEEAPLAVKLPTPGSSPVMISSNIPPVVPTTKTVPLVPKGESAKPATDKAVSLDEFSRFGKNAVTSSVSAPKPVFLQTESASRPIPNAPNFRIPTIAEDIMGGAKNPASLPVTSAVVEIGGIPIPKATSAQQSPATPKITIVRYGSEKSVAPPKPTAPPLPPKPEPMRTITEITSEPLKAGLPTPKMSTQAFVPPFQIPTSSPTIPKPPVSSTSAVPTPPTPPATTPKPTDQPPQKVILKNYSEAEK